MTDTPFDLPSWLRAVMSLDPDGAALEFEGSWLPWRALSAAADGLDAMLVGRSLGPGTAVGVVMRNRPGTVRAVAATLAAGRCVVTLSPVVPPAALAEEVRRLRLPVLVAGPADWRSPDLGGAVAAAGTLGLSLDDGEGPPEVVVAADVALGQRSPPRPGVAVQMLTSGTTGAPKRVDLLYSSLAHELVSTGSHQVGEPRLGSGVSVLWAPLVHIGGLRGLLSALVAGRPMALLERFTVAGWVELVERHRPRVLSLPPTAMRMVLDAGVARESLAGARVVLAGTAPVAPELAEQFEAVYGIPVLVVYGATEFAGGVAGWTIGDRRSFGPRKRGSVGRANPGVEVRTVEEDSGVPVAAGAVGVLEVRGPQLGGPSWVRTTDLASIDEDGFIWIIGRADDVVIRGGLKVSPATVREVLLTHPAVREAAVVGLPDDRLGQVPVAAVEVVDGPAGTVDPEDLRGFLRQRLAAYQVPVAIRVVESLPRTPSMKVSQPGVRALFEPPSS